MSKFKTNEDYFAYSKTLSVIPTEDILQLLQQFNIRVPFYIHRFVLRETIYSRVFQTDLYKSYTDEVKYRLRGFNDYSIYLLEKLLSSYNLEFDAANYKEIFFNVLFLNREMYHLKPSFIEELEKLKYKYTVDYEKISYLEFISQFSAIYYEPIGYLDGVSLKILKDVLVHSCTLGDLKGLGEKYSVKVPRRINKQKLIDILSARFRLTKEEALLLDEKSVLELEIYAKEKGFNISIDLKKSDMVEYLIFSLDMYHQEIQKDNHSYNVPLISEFDSVEIEAIEFSGTDQDIPVIEKEEETPIEKPLLPDEEESTPSIILPVETKPEGEESKEEEQVVIEPVKQEQPAFVSKPLEEVKPLPMEEIKEERKEEPKEPVEIIEPVSDDKKIEEPKPIDSTPKEPMKTSKWETPVQPVSFDFSNEEKELLDEKIELIIKKYHKKKRRKRTWTIILVTFLVLLLAFVGYSVLYYLQQNTLPFNIPVFW